MTGTNPPITFNPGTNPGFLGTNPPMTFNPGTNPGIAGTNPPFTFSPVNPTGFAGDRDKCIYKDITYGTTWQDGCTYNCL